MLFNYFYRHEKSELLVKKIFESDVDIFVQASYQNANLTPFVKKIGADQMKRISIIYWN